MEGILRVTGCTCNTRIMITIWFAYVHNMYIYIYFNIYELEPILVLQEGWARASTKKWQLSTRRWSWECLFAQLRPVEADAANAIHLQLECCVEEGRIVKWPPASCAEVK